MKSNQIQTLCRVLRTDLVYEAPDGLLTAFFDTISISPLMKSDSLRRILRESAQGQKAPYLYQDAHDCYFACIRINSVEAAVSDSTADSAEPGDDLAGAAAGQAPAHAAGTEGYLYMGPMCHRKLTGLALARMFNSYGISGGDYPTLPVFTLPQIRDMLVLTNSILDKGVLEDEELLQINSILTEDEENAKRDQTRFVLSEEEEDDDDAYRHSYHEEQLLMQAIRDGRAREAIRLAESMDQDSGQLSKDYMRHRRNLAMIGIALCSRAAIDGGLSPKDAYRISGYYIGKCDAAQNPASLLQYRNQAIEEMAGRIAKKLSAPASGNYVERCREYIRAHYREKIYLDDIADTLGLSPSYLSRLFSRETGEGIQDYAQRVRVERASNLLLYSDQSLSEIAQYVGFPNQSYLGKIFKKYRGMSPKAYQDRYRTPENKK